MRAPVCAVPASVNVTQGTAAPVTAKISTTSAETAGSISRANLPAGMMPITATIVLFASGLLFASCRRRIAGIAMLTVGMVFLGMTGVAAIHRLEQTRRARLPEATRPPSPPGPAA
jgi:hypothetical protein